MHGPVFSGGFERSIRYSLRNATSGSTDEARRAPGRHTREPLNDAEWFNRPMQKHTTQVAFVDFAVRMSSNGRRPDEP